MSSSRARKPWTSLLPDLGAIRKVLEAERKVEQDFAENARQSEKAPKGWPAALLLFHLAMWRERFRERLNDLSEGRLPAPPPRNADELNDAELPNGIGTPLADAAARSDQLLREIIDLFDKVGERPFQWYSSTTTTEAVLRNSYMHPRLHLFDYMRENGAVEGAIKLFEDAFSDLDGVAPPNILVAARYNLACARSIGGRVDEAITVLQEILPTRADLKDAAATDIDLDALRDDPRFKELIKR
ncbi:MAG TPA: hypothetical protein VLK30_10000 [Candidatus Limnocylindrales bacterium]|nr:hypothetical protein [Candidatus Limnocylindrales bacterium]